MTRYFGAANQLQGVSCIYKRKQNIIFFALSVGSSCWRAVWYCTADTDCVHIP